MTLIREDGNRTEQTKMANVDIETVKDATVIPVWTFPDRTYSCGVFDADDRAIESSIHRFSNEKQKIYPEVCPISNSKIEIDEAIFGGIALNHFGHFIMECLGRLWCVNRPEYQKLPILMQMPWGLVPTFEPGSYAKTVLDLLEIDSSRILLVDKHIHVKKLHMPPQIYGFHLVRDPSDVFVDFLRVAQKNILKVADGFSIPSEKIFISRSDWQDKSPSRGIVAGAHQFDDYLGSEGWHVIQPEQLTFIDQLKTYAVAKHILVSEGSAQHSFIFLPDSEAKVSVVLRRPDKWDVTRVTDQFLGFKREAVTIQEIEKVFLFGQPSWSGLTVVDYQKVSQQLLEMGIVDNVFTEWATLRDSSVRASMNTYIEVIRSDQKFIDFMMSL